mgnify:CR=1 FL=1
MECSGKELDIILNVSNPHREHVDDFRKRVQDLGRLECCWDCVDKLNASKDRIRLVIEPESSINAINKAGPFI